MNEYILICMPKDDPKSVIVLTGATKAEVIAKVPADHLILNAFKGKQISLVEKRSVDLGD